MMGYLKKPMGLDRRLDHILDRNHHLFKLANEIDWGYFVKEFGEFFVERTGQAGKPIRLLVGLYYLKQAYNESDESCLDLFLENPYWQFFCGFEYFQYEYPLKPESLVMWRKKIGREGIEKLVYQIFGTAQKFGLLKGKQSSVRNV